MYFSTTLIIWVTFHLDKLVGGFNPLKNMIVKLDPFPRDRGEHKKYSKPTTSKIRDALNDYPTNPSTNPLRPMNTDFMDQILLGFWVT